MGGFEPTVRSEINGIHSSSYLQQQHLMPIPISTLLLGTRVYSGLKQKLVFLRDTINSKNKETNLDRRIKKISGERERVYCISPSNSFGNDWWVMKPLTVSDGS